MLGLLALCCLAFQPALPPAAAQSRPAAEPADSSSDLFLPGDYTVREHGGLRFAGREQSVVKLRERPASDPTDAGAASLDVVSLYNGSPGEELESVARRQISRTEGVSGVTVLTGRRVTIDGLGSYELTASAADARTGTRLTLYHVVFPIELQRFILFRGRVSAGRAASLLPHFRAVAESLRRTGITRASLGELRYEVPSTYAAAPGQSDERVALFRNEGTNSGVFLALLDRGADRVVMLKDLMRRVTAAAVPSEPQVFGWRVYPVTAPSGFVVHEERLQGFNGSILLVVEVRHLRHQGRDFLTGYFYQAAEGDEAAVLSRIRVAMDNVAAGAASAWLIRSIVGEKAGEEFRPRVPNVTGPPVIP